MSSPSAWPVEVSAPSSGDFPDTWDVRLERVEDEEEEQEEGNKHQGVVVLKEEEKVRREPSQIETSRGVLGCFAPSALQTAT